MNPKNRLTVWAYCEKNKFLFFNQPKFFSVWQKDVGKKSDGKKSERKAPVTKTRSRLGPSEVFISDFHIDHVE
ncbi:MAG: hypothetical protein CSB33_00970 [Desulfobacterales bacterium]|nr:MAG: hypothetical protein CSB33_00970 [Desulfobacterales bacterium]